MDALYEAIKNICDTYGLSRYRINDGDMLHGLCNCFTQAFYDIYHNVKNINIRFERLLDKNREDDGEFIHEYCVVNDRYFVDARGIFDMKKCTDVEFYNEFLNWLPHDLLSMSDTEIGPGYGLGLDVYKNDEYKAGCDYAVHYIVKHNDDLFDVSIFE